jgi:hypothetical protein
MKNSVGWQIVMKAKIGFKCQVTATPELHLLYNGCYQCMWLLSGTPDNREANMVMEQHESDALYSTVKSLMHAIHTQDEGAQQDAAHRMIQIAKPCMTKRWSESKHTNAKPLMRLPKENPHLVVLEWTEDEQPKLKDLVEIYTAHGSSGAWRVHHWRLAPYSLVLGDTEDRNDISRQWYDEWALDT